MARFNLNEYITVQERINLFWKEYPDGNIITALASAESDFKQCRYRADVYRHKDDTRPAATGYAFELAGGGGANSTSHEENCETSAIGRALANLGYATSEKNRPSREEMTKANQEPSPQRTESPRAHEPARVASDDPNAATDAQKRRIFAMGRAVKGWEPDQIKTYIHEKRNKTIDELTKAEASALMDHWQSEVDAAEAARQ